MIVCAACGGPFHPATGHAWTATCVLCLRCTLDWARWLVKHEREIARPWRRPHSLESFAHAAATSIIAPLLAVLLLAGCPSTAGRGLTPAWSSRGLTADSRQRCLDDPALLPTADLALVLLGREAVSQGLAPSYEELARLLGRPAVCLLPEPEPCCVGSACQRDTDGQVREKAGCAREGGAWVSARWPRGQARDWREDLVHELRHVVAFAFAAPQRPDHQDPWAPVEAAALRAFRAALVPSDQGTK